MELLRLLARHGEPCRRFAIGLADGSGYMDAGHRQNVEVAMAGHEARARDPKGPDQAQSLR